MTEANPYIEYARLEGYGCVERVDLRLTRLHALVGPNDSGKSTVLDALRLVGALADVSGRSQVGRDFQRAKARAAGPGREERLRLAFISGSYAWACWSFGGKPVQAAWERTASGDNASEATRIDGLFAGETLEAVPGRQVVRQSALNMSIPAAIWGQPDRTSPLTGSRLVRLDPDAMRAPAAILTDQEPLAFRDERGTGLPAVVDAIVTRDMNAGAQLNKALGDLFPALQSIHLLSPGNSQKALAFKLETGEVVPSEHASEGMLYALAYLVLQHLSPVSLLLIEEPENGLHPARIREMVELLRKLSAHQQIVMATHSPLILNELQGDEISVLTRPRGAGSRAVRLCDTANYEDRARVYESGELWIAYCDGVVEHDLLEGVKRDWEAP